MSIFKGPPDTVEVATDEAFTTGLLTFSKFTKEGNTWPVPQEAKDLLWDEREGVAGWIADFEFRVVNPTIANIDTLADAGEALTDYFVRFKRTVGATVHTLVLKNVLLSAKPMGFADFGKYGGAVVSGRATGNTRADCFTFTEA